MTEVERIRRFGLTATEVNRQRDEYLSTLEKTYDNRDKQTHDFFVPQYVRFLCELPYQRNRKQRQSALVNLSLAV